MGHGCALRRSTCTRVGRLGLGRRRNIVRHGPRAGGAPRPRNPATAAVCCRPRSLVSFRLISSQQCALMCPKLKNNPYLIFTKLDASPDCHNRSAPPDESPRLHVVVAAAGDRPPTLGRGARVRAWASGLAPRKRA